MEPHIDEQMPTFFRRNYYWLVAVLVFAEMFVILGVNSNLNSIFLIPVCAGLSISRAAFSLTATIRSIISGVSNFFFGRIYARFGYRKLAAASLLVMAFAYVAYALCRSVWGLYLASAAIGLCTPFLSTSGTTTIVNAWFVRNRGVVFGIAMAAGSIGGAVFGVVMTNMIQRSTWHMPMWLAAGLAITVAILVWSFMRGTPQEMGLEPYRGKHSAAEVRKKADTDHTGFTLAYLLRRPVLYFMLLSVMLYGIVTYGAYQVVVPFFCDNGYSAKDAAVIQSVMFLAQAGSLVLAGLLCDHLSGKAVSVGCLVCNAVGILMILLWRTYFSAIVGVVLLAIGTTAPAVSVPRMLEELFGKRDVHSIMGVQQAVNTLSCMAAFLFMNLVYDCYGSYVIAFWISVGISGLTAAAYFVLFATAKREKVCFDMEFDEKSKNNRFL